MGLQTTATATSPTSVLSDHQNIRNQNYVDVADDDDQEDYYIINKEDRGRDEAQVDLRRLKKPNVSVHGTMAPALTEPLSQTNKLSSSTDSASPRPTSNNLLTNNNHTVENNNVHSSVHLSSGKESLNGRKDQKGTFQLAFERVVARQAAAAAAAKKKQLGVQATSEQSSNGPVTNQMSPMCDTNSTSDITDLKLESGLADSRQQVVIVEDLDESKEEEDRLEQSKEDIYFGEEIEHMDVTIGDAENDGQCSNENSQESQVTTTTTVTEEISVIATETVSTTTVTVTEASCDTTQSVSEESTKIEEEPPPKSDDSEDQESPATSSSDRLTELHHQSSNSGEGKESGVEAAEEAPSSTTDNIERRSPPRTPQPSATQAASSPNQSNSQQQSQTTPVPSLTPQSTTSGMGLQKDFIKDSAEMDQVLGDMDLLQVLKGFDTNPSGETLCDLEGSLVFFNDVDVMNYEEMGIPVKDSETKEIRLEIEKRQQQMQRKCDFLLRRLRKIQSRYMGKHASEEIAGLFEWTNRVVRRKDPEHNRQLSYEDDKHRSVSTASMRVLLKRIDTIATAQHSSDTKKAKGALSSPGSHGNINASSSVAPDPSKPPINPIIPQFDEKTIEEVDHVSGMLQTELKQVQSSLDSDVTASSSGGESADEMVTYNNQMQQSLSISKRAAWRWARDRAAIASRWTWLLAQISDLEYRIRQHNELHHQIKRNKGAVTFEKNPLPLLQSQNPQQIPLAATGTTTGNDSITNSPVGDVAGQILPPSSVNGYRGVLPGNTKPMDVDNVPPNGAYESSPINSAGSCRTKPFQRAGFRKRKLLQTANVHTVSKKVARPSTVKCGCQWPLHPCALCTGRSDPTAPRDLPDCMTPTERVALLDPGFHPVLSFPEDVGNSIHLEATLRSPEWQNRLLRCSSKSILKGAVAAQKAAEREDRSKKYQDSRRKYNRKYTPQDIMAANKLKNAKNRRALHTGQINNHLIIKSKHQRKLLSASGSSAGGGGGSSTTATSTSAGGGATSAATSSGNGAGNFSGSGNGNLTSIGGSMGPANGNNFAFANNTFGNNGGLSDSGFGGTMYPNDSLDGTNGILPRSKNASPTPGSHNSSNFKSERMDRRNRNSYDIDNIVIPYSVAAATRVEILPYKEIPTPKWRLIEDDSEDPDTESKEFETNSAEINTTNAKADSSNSIPMEDEDPEDISDEAIQNRHERALLEERKKFQTYLKFPWSTRSRANRRIDSRAESSGANTPDPTSPAPNTPSVGGDQESIPSPAAPSTPQNPLDSSEGGDSGLINNQNPILTPSNHPLNSISNSAMRRIERRRTVSLKKERDSYKEETRRSSTPDPKEITPPFEPLQFPLSDDLYETMLRMMPNDHQIMEDCLKTSVCDGNSIEPSEKGSFLSGKGIAGRVNGDGGGSGGGGISVIPIDGGAQLYATSSASSANILHDGGGDSISTFVTDSDLMLGGISDTDSAESLLQEEDPNDPEWREQA